MYKYKFSVIIPIYNAEKYLEEAILSIINQTIGFKENIQLILVNDGSTDNSEKICVEYEKKFSENITYIKQKNSGVSNARNNGIKYAEGKYVSFLDSDDKWALDAFETIYNFFEKNYDKIDIAVGRMKFFEANEDYHPLDYKYNNTKIAKIIEHYNSIHLHITSSVIKQEVAKKHLFDEKLKYGEDAKYVNEIILESEQYGIVKEAEHFYRKRLNSSSAVQNKENSNEWYTTTIDYFYKDLMEKSIRKYGRVIPYVQYLIMYDMQWRVKSTIPSKIKKEIRDEYVKKIKELLTYIEDYIIVEQKNIYAEHKIYILSLKYNKDITEDLEYKEGKLYFKNLPVFKIRKNESIFKIDILNLNNGKLVIEGRVSCPLPENQYKIFINGGTKEKIYLKLNEAKKSLYDKKVYAMTGEKILNIYTYKAEIPLIGINKINVVFRYKDMVENRLDIKFGKFSKICSGENAFYSKGKKIIWYENKNILLTKNSKKKRISREKNYLKYLHQIKEYEIIRCRVMYLIKKMLNNKDIWLISDREDKANDNGEHLFKYIVKNKDKNIKPYFVISKDCEDYKRMKKIGKVIKYGTFKHKVYTLLSDKIISSQANENIYDPFDEKNIYIRDFMNFDFIFLQHGIIKDDLSSWLKKYDKNIKMFVTSGYDEYESIKNGDYYYTENEIKLTGLPRYDNLIDKKEKRIIIQPTQRRNLVEWNSEDKYGKTYNPYFKESQFYKFYNGIINDERILKKLQEKGYKMKFILHPLLMKQSKDFKGNEYVEVVDGNVDYQEEFCKSSLLITDYSSVAFDFAYLKKPVIYTQFDKDSFYKVQIYDKGYFDYERDGFGPVYYDYESTVNAIIEAIDNDCKLEKEYLQRIEKFYCYFDNNNCKRVYEEILKIEK